MRIEKEKKIKDAIVARSTKKSTKNKIISY